MSSLAFIWHDQTVAESLVACQMILCQEGPGTGVFDQSVTVDYKTAIEDGCKILARQVKIDQSKARARTPQ